MPRVILTLGSILACTSAAPAESSLRISLDPHSKSRQFTKFLTRVQKYRANTGGIPRHDPFTADIADRINGDHITSAIPMAGNAWWDSGNTCLFTDDWDETCPDTDPGASPGGSDVFYLWQSTASSLVCLTLCDSFTEFDTKLSVYDASIGVGIGLSIACNDDHCSAGLGMPWVSQITTMAPQIGSSYFVMVDGWSVADCGNYALAVGAGCGPTCLVLCPTGALDPDNGLCGYTGTANNAFALDGNNGCFSNPPDTNAANPLNCGDIYCGTTFLDSSLQLRDLDWFRFDFAQTMDISLALVTENPDGLQLFVVGNDGSCDSLPILATISTGDNCDTISLTLIGFPIEQSIFLIVAPFGADTKYDCPNEQHYVLAVDACNCGPYLPGNVNNTGTSRDVVDVDDLNFVLANWGNTCQ